MSTTNVKQHIDRAMNHGCRASNLAAVLCQYSETDSRETVATLLSLLQEAIGYALDDIDAAAKVLESPKKKVAARRSSRKVRRG